MVFNLIPLEIRCPSVITIVLFAIGTPLVWYLHRRIASLETVVMERCIDIERLAEMVSSMKDDNQKMIDWIRTENTDQWRRVEKNISEIRQKMYRGD